MPKRKRSTSTDDHQTQASIHCQAVAQRIALCKKQLYRVIKTAKSFERQKLGKRLTRAESADVKQRINLEIDALKNLDSAQFAEMHLYKSLLRVKTFVSSGLLPADVQIVDKATMGEGAQRTALNNVMSGILNMKVVKATMEQIFKDMYSIMGIPVSVRKSTDQKRQSESNKVSELARNSQKPGCSITSSLTMNKDQDTLRSPEWESFESDNDEVEKQAENSGRESSHEGSIDDEELARFDSLIANDSDEESFDEKECLNNGTQASQLCISPSHSSICSDRLSNSQNVPFVDSSARPTDLTKSKAKPQPAKTGLSTFLPTLMGGYWSGSESASDLEDFAPAPKKNRPGQIARRAIAEKKYGQNANHIKLGKGSVINKNGKDDGWDKKRGAIDTSAPKNRRYNRSQGSQYNTGVNSGEMIPHGRLNRSAETGKVTRAKGMGSRDDVGVLHPSWQAAKKAKEAKQTAKFQGKKVVFD
ncbi:hypothetical protein K3495_g6316 [Podosphaera aphanis]|nr:hypothetical protein K3495_g6316 [Podosphaera aphanis]